MQTLGFPPYRTAELSKTYQKTFNSRKQADLYDAAIRLRKEGFRWIISIDPDELIHPTLFTESCGDLMFMLNKNYFKYSQLYFRPVEVVRRNLFCNPVPFDEDLFSYVPPQNSEQYIEVIMHQLRQLVLEKNRRVYEDSFYIDCYKNHFIQVIANPNTGMPMVVGTHIGYTSHKSAFNLLHLDFFYPRIHKWVPKDKGHVYSWINCGHILHYICFDCAEFYNKFVQRGEGSDILPTGNGIVSEHMSEWRKFVCSNSIDTVTEYFRDSLIFKGDVNEFLERGLFRRMRH